MIVDTSIWVARMVSQEQWADGICFISPTLLLVEVEGPISRRTGNKVLSKKALTHLENLPGLQLVEMDHELVQAAALLTARLGLRGVDSLYVASAQQLGLPLVTFDMDQRERAKEQVRILSILNNPEG